MSGNRRNSNGDEESQGIDWGALLGVGAGIAAGVAALTIASKWSSNNQHEEQAYAHQEEEQPHYASRSSRQYRRNQYPQIQYESSYGRVDRERIPVTPIITNLNTLVETIYHRYVALKQDEFQHYFNIVTNILRTMQTSMKEVDSYYNQYASRVHYIGSFAEGLRVTDSGEFDVNIVIRLPVCMEVDKTNPYNSDIIIEPKNPGFVQLKAGKKFKDLPLDVNNWRVNKQAYLWMDEEQYLLRTEFSYWFQGVIDKALDKHKRPDRILSRFYVDGKEYKARRFHNGPAFTLQLTSDEDPQFKIDVDLVPSIRFSEERWLNGKYRDISRYGAGEPYWTVVPKTDKNGTEARSWRICVYDQECKVMHDLRSMKKVIRLMKKLRDTQEMHKIASYYIKTIFFWETLERDPNYWNKNFVDIFKDMLVKFRQNLFDGSIKFFWHQGNNLIEDVKKEVLDCYVRKLTKLINICYSPTNNTIKDVAKFFLSEAEMNDFKNVIDVNTRLID